jgi:hypothetical protein
MRIERETSAASNFSACFKGDTLSRQERSLNVTTPLGVRVLSISDDAGLGLSRRLLLENAGYALDSIESDGPLTAPYVRSFDAAILCQSVGRECALKLMETLRRYHPGIRILRINLQTIEPDSCYDGICDSLTGPQRFLDAVRRMLTGSEENGASAPPVAH